MAILTVDELRENVNSGLGDDALQRLLDAAEAEIVAHAGESGERTEYISGGSHFITTTYPINSIGSITETRGETVTTLASGDYLHRSPYVVQRLRYGTNPASHWRGRVAITYTPVADDAIRAGVQIDLINLMLSYSPGLTGQTIGAWGEQYATNSAWNNSMERQSILARLLPDGTGMLVIG